MKIIKVLIVDDEVDIRELLVFYLSEKFTIQHSEAGNVNDAIKLIDKAILENAPFDVCISDFNMPGGKGTKIFEHIINNNIKLPFVYATSVDDKELKFSDKFKVTRVNKPFQEDDIYNAVASLLLESNSEILNLNQDKNEKKISNYSPISIDSLIFLKLINYSLYVKINEESYVKVSYPKTVFSNENYNHYVEKNIKQLYLLSSDYKELVNSFAQKVNSSLFLKIEDEEEFQQFKLSEQIQKFITDIFDQFGWSKELEEIAVANLKNIIYLAQKNKNLKKLLNSINFEKMNKASAHCVLNSITSIVLMKEFNFPVEDYKFIGFAAFFHDNSLSDYIIENEFKFYQTLIQKRPNYKDELKMLISHPNDSVSALTRAGFTPELVKTIILQHHEKPDGSGFPNGIKENLINEYSAVFIIAEHLTFAFLEHVNWSDLKSEWEKYQYLNVGKFSKYYNSIKNLLVSE